jgi:hypothetical protein
MGTSSVAQGKGGFQGRKMEQTLRQGAGMREGFAERAARVTGRPFLRLICAASGLSRPGALMSPWTFRLEAWRWLKYQSRGARTLGAALRAPGGRKFRRLNRGDWVESGESFSGNKCMYGKRLFRCFLGLALVCFLFIPEIGVVGDEGQRKGAQISDPRNVSGSLVSDAATKEQALLCSNPPQAGFPRQWVWKPEKIIGAQSRAATAADKLPPRIEQYRHGKLIAVYSKLGGSGHNGPNASQNPSRHAAEGLFSRFGYRMWQDGDTFLVYPAVYSGLDNQPWIGPIHDVSGGPVYTPANLTIRGVTVNGMRPVILDDAGSGNNTLGQAPVYFDKSSNLVFENIDVRMVPGGRAGKAGVYVNGPHDLTLRNMRIHGFQYQGHVGFSGAKAPFGENGIITTPNTSGILTLDHVELYENGSSDGPAHNIYISASSVDPNFTVHMLNSWSHDAFYGHLFKSRAQVNILENNYFQGGLPQGQRGDLNFDQAENWLVDIPNGGRLIMRRNILVKNASGPNSNGASVTFAVEGIKDAREQSAVIENNTFVALAKTYDGSHPIWPFFFYQNKLPGSGEAVLSAGKYSIASNIFAGYCTQANAPAYSYRGDSSITVAFGELNADYTLKTRIGKRAGKFR